jgi:hypothetical protein
MLLGFTMLCDFISAAAEFMVRLFDSNRPIGIYDGAGVEARRCM